MADQKRPALGKGLSALIPDAPDRAPGVLEIEVDRNGKASKLRYLPRGEAVDGFSWAFAPKAPSSCGVGTISR